MNFYYVLFIENGVLVFPQVLERSNLKGATGATPDIMLLPTLPPKEGGAKVKEASVVKSPLSSPPKHERHYIPNTKV